MTAGTAAGLNVFQCFIPGGTDREGSCATTDRPLPRPEFEGAGWGDRYRLYRDLAELAPEGDYVVSTPEPYINGESPLMLTVISDAADVTVVAPALSAELAGAHGSIRVGEVHRTYRLYSTFVYVRADAGPVERFVVHREGRIVRFTDVRLLPDGIVRELP